jgi:hypothetical protein
LKIFQVKEEGEISGAGVTTTIKSAIEEQIWTVESHIQTPSRVCRRRTDLICQIWARGPTTIGIKRMCMRFNPLELHRRVGFEKL